MSIRTTGSQDPWNNDTWTFLVLKTSQQTSVDSYEALYDSTRFARSRVSRKSTSGMTNRQKGKRFVSIRSNRVESTFLNHPALFRGAVFSKSRANRLPACRIDRRGNDCRPCHLRNTRYMRSLKRFMLYTRAYVFISKRTVTNVFVPLNPGVHVTRTKSVVRSQVFIMLGYKIGQEWNWVIERMKSEIVNPKTEYIPETILVNSFLHRVPSFPLG